MAKRQQRTKVIVNGQDVSHFVQRVDISRGPDEADQATITFYTKPLQVDEEGNVTITIDTRE